MDSKMNCIRFYIQQIEYYYQYAFSKPYQCLDTLKLICKIIPPIVGKDLVSKDIMDRWLWSSIFIEE